MPRKYLRKSDRGARYTKQQLLDAVEAVKNGNISSYAASKMYNIPRPTIVNRVYGRKGDKSDNFGRPTVLSKDVEVELVQVLHIMEKYGLGLTRKELLEAVAEYVTANNIKTPFKDNKPGEDWFLGFKQRHGLSVKKPQPVEYARKQACRPAVIYPYFDLLEETILNLGLTDKPSHIWNCDETSFSQDPSKSKVVGLRGHTSTRTISSPGKTNTTVLLACSAAGEKAPPLIVYKGKNVWDQWVAEDGFGYPGTVYAATSNGWMEAPVFEKFIEKVFLPTVGEKRPVLLIFDGHSTHVGINVIKIAREHNITILKIPPHTSDHLQPLDLAVNKSFKDRWDVALVKWQRLNIGTVLPKKEFARIIGEVWTEIDPKILAAGFRKAGIYPINKNAIPENKFDPILLSEWKQKANKSGLALSVNDSFQKGTTQVTSFQLADCDPELKENILSPSRLSESALATVNKIFKAPTEVSTPRLKNIHISLENYIPIATNEVIKCTKSSETCESVTESKLKDSNHTQQSSKIQILDDEPVVSNIKFEQLLLKYIKSGRSSSKTKRRKVAGGAEVITHDEVYKRCLLMEEEKKNKNKKQQERKDKYKTKEQRQQKKINVNKGLEDKKDNKIKKRNVLKTKKKRRRVSTSSSEDEDEITYNDESDTEEFLEQLLNEEDEFIEEPENHNNEKDITYDDDGNNNDITQEPEKDKYSYFSMGEEKINKNKKQLEHNHKYKTKQQQMRNINVKKEPQGKRDNQIKKGKVSKTGKKRQRDWPSSSEDEDEIKYNDESDTDGFLEQLINEDEEKIIEMIEEPVSHKMENVDDGNNDDITQEPEKDKKYNKYGKLDNNKQETTDDNSNSLFNEDDWLLVQFTSKNSVKHYVGVVLRINKEGFPVVKFAQKKSKSNDESIFTFPLVEDVSEVKHRADIVSILPKPLIGRRGHIIFKMFFNSFNIQ